MDNQEEKNTRFLLFRKIAVALFWLLLFLLFLILDMINPICFMFKIGNRTGSASNSIISLILLSFVFIVFLVSFIFGIIAHITNKDKLIDKAYGALDLTIIIPIVMTFFLMIDVIFFSIVRVSGLSMNNTLEEGDTILSYHAKESSIKKEDIVILYVNVLDEDILIVKRVKATEGDTISFKNIDGIAVLTINGESIDTGPAYGKGFIFFDDYTLKKDEIFVMGDNYVNSIDSRSLGVFKLKGKDKNATYCAKAIFSIKPFGKIEQDLAYKK